MYFHKIKKLLNFKEFPTYAQIVNSNYYYSYLVYNEASILTT